MSKQILIICVALFVGLLNALPPGSKNQEPLRAVTSSDVQLLNPHIITIERLEGLLKKASEIFRPYGVQQRMDTDQQLPIPMQYMQPPANQPYNFYLPLFEYDQADAQTIKLDDKSRKMEKFTPPPEPKQGHVPDNYYTMKPKKAPKKFNANSKHINVKWLNKYEKQLSSPSNDQAVNIPKDVFLANDERNRINFDDTFFAVDMKVPEKTNKLDKTQETDQSTNNEDYQNQGEEDLIAAAAFQIPLITQLTSLRRI